PCLRLGKWRSAGERRWRRPQCKPWYVLLLRRRALRGELTEHLRQSRRPYVTDRRQWLDKLCGKRPRLSQRPQADLRSPGWDIPYHRFSRALRFGLPRVELLLWDHHVDLPVSAGDVCRPYPGRRRPCDERFSAHQPVELSRSHLSGGAHAAARSVLLAATSDSPHKRHARRDGGREWPRRRAGY